MMNKLSGQHSTYLQHAAHQPVDWHPWSEEAFNLARERNKPVFLSTGAVWCHWCHVMAGESFEDEETARLLNANFVCIKLDRDERPDIDRRFQQAVAAMGGGNGWPLSVFLTPDKQAFYGGTYFPPDDRQGRPSFKKVLKAVSEFYVVRKQDALSYAATVVEALKPEPGEPEDLDEGLLAEAERTMLSVFDTENGGFGSMPKFPLPGAIEFLLRRSRDGSKEAGEAARKTLSAMAAGGFHDQLGGGFHRYSVDEAWRVPHFEKMADDNAGLLRNYSEGYALFGGETFLQAARGILKFAGTELADPGGGFYASQDADVTPEDEGGYFTWTDAELREVLDARQYEAMTAHFIHPGGSMHHDPRKNVLTSNQTAAAIAEGTGKSEADVEALLQEAKGKMLARRLTRTAPLVDKMLYPSLNGMMIAAYFRAYNVMDEPAMLKVAERALERILNERFRNGVLWHAEGIPGLLEDYIHVLDALVAGYEATARPRYLERAEALMGICGEKFLDAAEGGFFDTEGEVLGLRLKRIEDVPHPSPNAVAIRVLLRLAAVTGKEDYRREAERSLKLFAGIARNMGVHGGSYFCALHAYYRAQALTIEAAPDSSLARAARLAAARSYSSIAYGPDTGRLIACKKEVCSEPVRAAEDLPAEFSGVL
jgi:hypothetical protein